MSEPTQGAPAAGSIEPMEPEESLDPQDWEGFRELCHGMLDEALDFLQQARERPVWTPVPDAVKAKLREDLPAEPQGPEQVCDDFRQLVLPYATGNTHPRFFGWVHGSGTPGGMLAEMLAAAMNANLGGRDHAPIYVERQVIEWCRRIFGFPEGASGLLVSGTSMATLIGLTVARNHKAGGDPRQSGLSVQGGRLVAYSSDQAHGSVTKALEILGLGRDGLRPVPANAAYRMNPKALRQAIEADRQAGLRPFCVVATAGTVNTGAIDDLAAIADICAEHDLWLHVDGAFGAAIMLSETLRPRLAGIERADSLAFDFHKWLHVPYDAGCILLRDGALHRAAFSSRQDYLASAPRGLAGGDPWFCEYGPELSRGFRALKVWFTLKEHGTRRLARKIEDNCRQARTLASLVADHALLELMAPVPLNIVCFRFAPPGATAKTLDRINGEIVAELQESGVAAPSTTRLKGALVIRANITNHRCRREDLDALMAAVVAAGEAASGVQAPEDRSPEPAALDFRLAVPARIDGECAAEDRALIEAACRRPELRLLSAPVTVFVDRSLEVPFQVSRGERVVLGSAALINASVAALHLRHALELALLQRLTPGPWAGTRATALALLACRAGGFYHRSMIAVERAACRAHLAEWLCDAFEELSLERPSELAEQRLSSLAASLLPLQSSARFASSEPVAWSELRELLAAAEVLSAPAEHLLTMGADTRLRVDPETGLNGYGCSPRPRPWAITFASSTASSISDLGYQTVEGLRQGLLSAALLGDLGAAERNEVELVKSRILRFCGAAGLKGSEVILTTSGTDAELYSLYLALRGGEKRVVNIVIAPDETGSGVVEAAWGRHFAPLTPSGAAVEPGAPLDGFAEGKVRVETVAARDGQGALKPMAEIDRAVERLVDQAVAEGARCLLHLLDSAKTGWGAPSLDSLLALRQRHGRSLDIVVDACQMRVGPATLRAYLGRGFMVQVTGSKFFTGPPFSGALILPPDSKAWARELAPMPTSFADYAARPEWPRGWDAICRPLPKRANLGLLCRWTAALWEMRAFATVPGDEQERILAAFGRDVLAAIEARAWLEAVPAPTYRRGAVAPESLWDRQPTIFPFMVMAPKADGTRRPLSYEAARQVYRWLNMDISDGLPTAAGARERRIAARCCHIGQPVRIQRCGDDWIGALRLCAGARLVSGASFDPVLGDSPQARLRRETEDALLVLDKIGLIVEYWSTIETVGDKPRVGEPIYRI